VRHRAADNGDDAALLEGVDAEAGQAGDAEGEVDLVLLGELRELVLVAQQARQDLLGVLGSQGRLISGGEGTFRCRSEPSLSMTRRRAASRSNIYSRIGG
jgi:hypothetical protein